MPSDRTAEYAEYAETVRAESPSARLLRRSLDVAGAWYHVMDRGHWDEAWYLDDADRHRFLGGVAEWPAWQGAREPRAVASR